MRRFLRFLGIALGVLIGILLVAVLAVFVIPNDTYRGWLSSAVQSSTGRELTLDAFSFDIGSSLTLEAGGFTFANADWATESAMFSAVRLRAEVALRPLLSGILEVSVSADRPQVALETDSSGLGNWDFGTKDPKADSEASGQAAAGIGFDIHPTLSVTDARLDYIDGVGGARERFDLNRLDLGDVDGRLTVELEGAYRDEAILVNADLGELRSILTGQTTDSVAEAHFGEIRLLSKGRYANLLGPPGPTLDVQLTLDAPSTTSLSPFAGRPIPELGELAISGRIEGSDGALAGRELEVKLDGPHTVLDVSGQIENLLSVTGADLSARLSSDSLGSLAQALGVTLPAESPQSVEATFALQSRDESYEIPDIDVVFFGEDANGEIKGRIADVVGLTGIELDVKAYIDSLKPYSELAGVDLPDTTPLNITANLTGEKGAAEEASITAELASDWLKGQLHATLGELRAFQGVQADFDLQLQSLAMFSGLIGRELPAMGPALAKARLASQDRAYLLTDVSLNIQDGPLQLDLSGGVADLLAGTGVDFDVDARIASLSNFSGLVGTALPETKPLRVKAKAVTPVGEPGPVELNANIESEWLNGQIQASLDDVVAAAGLAATAELKLTALDALSAVVGHKLPAMGPVSARAKLASSGETYALTDLNLSMSDAALQAQVTGSVLDLLAVAGIDLAVQGNVDNMASLSQLAGVELLDTPAIALEGKLNARGGVGEPADVSALIRSENVTADLQGSLANLSEMQGGQMALLIKAATLAEIGRLVGQELADISPVEVRADIVTSPEELALNSLFAVVGRSDVRGDLKMQLAGEGRRGLLTGLFESRVVDMPELAGRTQAGNAVPAAADSETDPSIAPATSGETMAATSGGTRVFSDEPFPVDLLNQYDGSVEFKAEQLRLKDIAVERARLTAELDSGEFDLVLHRADVGGRPIEGGLKLDASQQPVPVHFEFHADIVPVSGVLSRNSMLEGGEVLADVSLDGRGNSVRKLMAGLDGHVSVAVRDTRLSNQLLGRFGADILSQINPLTAGRGYSGIECAAAAFEVKDGMATTPRGLIARETEATWIGQGQIDLKTEQIGFDVSSKPRKGIGLSAGALASALRFGGTLANPTLEVNPLGVAQKSAEAFLALSTGGMSIFAKGLFDRATSDQGVCEQILQLIIQGKTPGDPGEVERQ